MEPEYKGEIKSVKSKRVQCVKLVKKKLDKSYTMEKVSQNFGSKLSGKGLKEGYTIASFTISNVHKQTLVQ